MNCIRFVGFAEAYMRHIVQNVKITRECSVMG